MQYVAGLSTKHNRPSEKIRNSIKVSFVLQSPQLPLQIWQCGGQVLIATCSRVGHVFRKHSPYSWPGGVKTILQHNTRRTVEVWMDDYSKFYYAVNKGSAQRPLCRTLHVTLEQSQVFEAPF